MTKDEALFYIKELQRLYAPQDKRVDEAIAIAFELNKPTWVPVSEELPEEDEDVLVTVYFRGLKQRHKNGWNDDIKPCYYVDIATHIGGDWSSMSDEYKVSLNRHVVIAWRPLPEPYKESEGK